MRESFLLILLKIRESPGSIELTSHGKEEAFSA
jgi:hypothetical protein